MQAIIWMKFDFPQSSILFLDNLVVVVFSWFSSHFLPNIGERRLYISRLVKDDFFSKRFYSPNLVINFFFVLEVIIQVHSFITKYFLFCQVHFAQEYRLDVEKLCIQLILPTLSITILLCFVNNEISPWIAKQQYNPWNINHAFSLQSDMNANLSLVCLGRRSEGPLNIRNMSLLCLSEADFYHQRSKETSVWGKKKLWQN